MILFMYNTLIVDDDIATLYMLKRFGKWEQSGFSVAGEACDGKEALQKLEERPYDLIITDIKMPGMDGIEFIQELRNRDLDTCIIFLSTHSDFEYAKQGIRFGVFEYMTKPLEEEILLEILQRAKIHIDVINEQKAKLSEQKSKDGIINGAYYPKNHESAILSAVLNGEKQLEDTAEEAFREICTVNDLEAAKIRVLANTLLYNVRSGIDEAFPWLNKIEGSAAYPCIETAGSPEDMQNEFTAQLTAMQEKIQKYQLNHADGIIRKICQCVIDNIEKEISLELISNEVHISRDYVGKLFKQKVLCNLNDYVTRVKMEHAKYLILSGEFKNYEISEKLGYKKADYFSSLFKAYTGYTPMEFKKSKSDK